VLLSDLMFAIIRKTYAFYLALGAIIGVAASIIIMNLLMGYFAVASEAYTSVHPHVTIHGSWPEAEAAGLAASLPSLDPRIVKAAPGIHFDRTITLASVDVLSGLCQPDATAEQSCKPGQSASTAVRTYGYNVKTQRVVDVQVRGISVNNNETIANFSKLMAGESDFTRLTQDRDSNGNELPVAFLAQDNLISSVVGSFLISPEALNPSYPRYYRLQGVIRLGAKSSGAPLLVTGLRQALAIAPAGLKQPNVIEASLSEPLQADAVVQEIRKKFGPDARIETWIDRERSAFEFLNATWVMVFFVMLNISLVVAISIYSTLTLSILRNRWKIALLGALGSTPGNIGTIFLTFAIVIALAGVVGGSILGYFASRWLGGWLYETFLGLPPERFAATIGWEPVIWMSAATILIFIISALLPVRRAVSIRPAEALSGQA
jgi:ABC-type lipoprotein release transport system permease subunit